MAAMRPGEVSGRVLESDVLPELAGRPAASDDDLARRVVDALPILIAYIDREQRYTFANAACRQWFGIGREALLGRSIDTGIDEAACEEVRAGLTRALTGEAVTFEISLHPPGAPRREVLASLVPHRDGGQVLGVCAALSDITEQKRAETEARRLAAIVEASADAIVSATVDGRFTSWNASAAKLFGYSAEEALGAPISIILPKDRLEERQQVVERLRRGERVEHFESVRLTRSGERIPVSVGFGGIRDTLGELVGVAAAARDISERKRVEQQLEVRARQQDAVARLGHSALAGAELQHLMNQAVGVIADTLQVEFALVLELGPSGSEFVLRAGCGWQGVEIGRTTASARLDTQAGYTVATGKPVVIEDLGQDARFGGSSMLRAHQVVSGLSVVIAGEGGRAYGVLGAHSARRRAFSPDDLHFVEAVANVLASAIQRRRAEDQQALLLAELSHRVKNTLAVVQSLAAITGERASSIAAFLDSFRGRLGALATTHALLSATRWRGASLRQLAEATLAPLVGSDRLRLVLEPVDLRPAAAQTISLLFHELATNAGKYGALTAPGGQITLRAAVVDEPGRAELELVWQEDGGPEVETPAEGGFGTSVLFRAIEHQHDGRVSVDWRPAGVICTVCMPVQEAVAGRSLPGERAEG